MTKFFALALALAAGFARAQTPATNPMPDGSRDMYVGVGLVSTARYEGADEKERKVLPVLQVQWSNGVFVSGASAGIHLSRDPRFEFGPLVELHPGRDASGTGGQVGGLGETRLGLFELQSVAAPTADGLAGMAPIHARLQAGGFLNTYLSPQWRLTSSLLYGAGNARHGAKLELGVQRLATQVGGRHRLALTAGVALANRSYNEAFFGVGEEDSFTSGHPTYAPGGGLNDAHLGLRWNWAWSPAWMLTSNVQATRLLGGARHSPLVERPTNLTVSTAIAFRF